MPNELEKAGSVGKPTRYKPLFTNRFFSGLWTQRNPLRDAATPFIYEKFYGSRFDALIDGANVELTNRLTLQRRPGLSVYNSHSFPEINTFYSFRHDNTITVLADTANDVYNATGPSTGSSIFTKSGTGQTSFLSVGNTLFFGNGSDAVKYNGSAVTTWGIAAPTAAPSDTPLAFLGAPIRYWAKGMQVQPGYAILDGNGNVQLCTNKINTSQYLTQNMSPAVLANGGTVPGDYEGGVDQGHNPIAPGTASAYSNPNAAIDGSQATCASVTLQHTHTYAGITWAFSFSGDPATISQLKLNVLSSVSAPILTARDAGIWYSTDNAGTWTKVYQSTTRAQKWDTVTLPGGTDPNHVQVLAFTDSHDDMGHQVFEVNLVANVTLVSVALGTNTALTGTQMPVWNTTLYGSTNDNHAIWENMGPISQWQGNTTYNFAGPSAALLDANGNLQVIQTPGVSGPTPPSTWATAPGDTTSDGTITWLNVGPGAVLAYQSWDYVYGYHTTSGHVSTASPATGATGPVLGVMQLPVNVLGSAAPDCDFIWIFRTVDGGATYLYDDAIANPGTTTIAAVPAGLTAQGVTFLSTTAGTAANNVTIQLISTGTADATAITTTTDAVVVDVKKSGGALRTITEIVAMFGTYGATRANTTSGGVIQATGSGSGTLIAAAATHLAGGAASYLTPVAKTFTDTHPDSDLNEFLQAPIAHGNDMPPVGINNLCFHLGRIWGSGSTTADSSTVYYSRVLDATAGNPLESFPPNNYITFPSKVTKLYASGMGLLVFTISDVYVVLWQGTTNSLIQTSQYAYMPGVGLLSPNAFAVNGSIIYMHTNDGQVICFDPSSGVSEIGFPIGDQITWSPLNTYLTWHVSGSGDKAVYVADGSTGWFRCNPTSAPEAGLSWSPKATIAVGVKCVQSIEVDRGVKRLLVGTTGGGPILQRDTTAFSDNGTTYTAHATIGSLNLAQPGQMAELSFIATDSIAVGTRPTIGVRLDELSGAFASLTTYVADPPQLVASSTIYGSRYYFSQTLAPAWCRHLQVDISWPAEAYKNELLTYTIYGSTWNE